MSANARSTVAKWLAFVAGLLVPTYLLDESIGIKQLTNALLAAVSAVFVLASSYDLRAGTPVLRAALIAFAFSFCLSTGLHGVQGTVPLNAIYPLIFAILVFRLPKNLSPVATGLFVSLVAVVLLGWYRFVFFVGGDAVEHALGYWGIKYTSATRNSDALAPMILLALSLGSIRFQPQVGRIARALPWVGLTLSAPAAVLSYSRSCWMSLAFFCTVLFWSRHGRGKLPGALAIVIAASASWFGVSFLVSEKTLVDLTLEDRLQSIFDTSVHSSNEQRIRLLEYGLQLGLDHPLGVGPSQFHLYAEQYGFPDLVDCLHPENLPMHFFTEYGWAPAAFFVFYSLALIWHSRRFSTPKQQFGLAALVALFVWLQFNSELPSLLLWFVLGLICSMLMRKPVLLADPPAPTFKAGENATAPPAPR